MDFPEQNRCLSPRQKGNKRVTSWPGLQRMNNIAILGWVESLPPTIWSTPNFSQWKLAEWLFEAMEPGRKSVSEYKLQNSFGLTNIHGQEDTKQ